MNFALPTRLLVCWLCLASSVAAADRSLMLAALESIQADELQRHIDVLADDTFEGRAAGSRGGRAAAVYVARQMARAKLRPAGARGWYQLFRGGYRNVLGRIEGSDAKLKDEYLVVGAHYDHVGYGTPRTSYGPLGYIHNGADDNASGVSALLELAEAFAVSGVAPRRSILFVAWDGEEQGLLGSQYWVNEPTVPLEQVKFFVNLDMIGRLRERRLEIVGSRTARSLRRLVVLHAADRGLRLKFPWKIKRDSDHWTFYQRGIPCLMFHTGKHPDYHRPSDDADKINAEGIQRIGRLLFELVLDLADREQVPAFRAASRRETAGDRLRLEQPLPPAPPRLGVWWDARDRRRPGLLITRVAAGSPAQAAGLRAGDRLLRFNGETPRTSDQLRRAVFAAPRDVELTIARSGEPEPLTLSVTLAGKPLRVGIAWRADAAEPRSVLLSRVAPGSPAAAAGLRAGDRIYRVDGADFLGTRDFRGRIEVAEGPTQLLVEREGRARQVEIVLPAVDSGV